MKFINPSVKLEALTLPVHMRDGKVASHAVNLFNEVVPGSTESVIELAGRTCYKSEDKITESSSINFCKMIQTRSHLSVIEHCSATFRIVTSRDILQEVVRHRLASYSVESTRYCTYSEDKKGMQFVLPYWVNEQDIKNWESPDLKLESKGSLEFILTCKDAEQRYNALIKEGFKPQEARSILPGCLKTEVVMTANFREWQHFLELRTSPAAHPDMRIVANLIATELAIISPILFEKYIQSSTK